MNARSYWKQAQDTNTGDKITKSSNTKNCVNIIHRMKFSYTNLKKEENNWTYSNSPSYAFLVSRFAFFV